MVIFHFISLIYLYLLIYACIYQEYHQSVAISCEKIVCMSLDVLFDCGDDTQWNKEILRRKVKFE